MDLETTNTVGSKTVSFNHFLIGVLVFIITGLRIQALRMVNAQDFTYSKGYLGLLSTLGASLGIIICCAPCVIHVYRAWRKAYPQRASHILIDEENATTSFEIPGDITLPIVEDNATLGHDRSTRWSIDGCIADAKPPPYGKLQKHRTF